MGKGLTHNKKDSFLFERHPSPMLIFDFDTLEIVDVNRAAVEKYGYSKEEFEKLTLNDIRPPDDVPELKKVLDKNNEGEIYADMYRHQKRNSEIFYVRIIAQPYPSDQRNLRVIFIYDLTQLVEVQKKLEFSEQKFRSIFENANDGIFLMKGDCFLNCNEEITRIYECRKEEILGKSPFDFSPEEQPDGRNSREKGMEKIKAALAGEPQIFEWKHITGKGNYIDVEVSLNKLVLSDETYIQAIVRDLTKHKAAREELKKNEEMFRRLFLQAPTALVMIDSNNRVKMINKSFEELFGYTETELKGNDLDKYIVPEDQYDSVPKMPAREFKNTSYYHEAQRISKSGEIRDVFVGSIPVYVNDDPVVGFGMYIDITEQKKSQKEVQKSLEEKNVLLSEIHHRVKNNLAVISGLLQLKSMNIDNEEVISVLKESQLRIQSMAMIHEKLYESQDFANLKFGNYVEQLVEVITGTLEDTDKNITVEINSDDIELNINQAIPSALIINEMVTNAYEYAFQNRDSGRILINLRENELEEVQLRVSDDGVGLPANFEQRTHESLGLTLIERLTSQLHGQLEYGNDDGAYFQISFKKSGDPGSSSHLF